MGSSASGWPTVEATPVIDPPGYTLLRVLNRGGQGVVFLAQQESTHRKVAVKLMRDGLLASDRQRLRFEREIDLISRLRHPNVVRLFDSGISCGRRYYAMDYIDGRTIDEYVILRDLRPRRIVEMIIQVGEAVAYAHQNGILHRDIKPSNILVDHEGRAYVCDFGLAVAAADDSGPQAMHTQTGQVLGTLPYLSPEQAGGYDGKADVRSDVYALGLVLYHLLTDDFPYPVEGPAEFVRLAIISEEPKPIRTRLAEQESGRALGLAEINRDLELILAKALSKTKDRRYQSMDAFLVDLRAFLSGDVIQARPPSAWYLAAKLVRRHRVTASIAATACVTLSVASLGIISAWMDARNQRDLALEAYHGTDEALRSLDAFLSTLPGGLAARETFHVEWTERLMGLERLAKSLRSERLLATVEEQRGDLASQQGRRTEALSRYSRALLMVRNQSDLVAEVRIRRKRASVSDKPESPYVETISLCEQEWAAGKTDDDGFSIEFARTLTAFAEELLSQDRRTEALAPLQRVVSLATSIRASPDWDRLLANAYRLRGHVRTQVGEPSGGLDDLKQALGIQRTLLENRPADVRLRIALAQTYVFIGLQEWSRGDAAAAIEQLETALHEGNLLRTLDPTLTDLHVPLYQAHDALARMSIDQGVLDRARTHSGEANCLVEQLLAVEDCSSAHELRANAAALSGRVLLAGDELEAASEAFARSVEEFRNLRARDPANLRHERQIADIGFMLGSAWRRAGLLETAEPYYRDALAVRTELYEHSGRGARESLGVAMAQLNLASLLFDRESAADVHDAEAWGLTEACGELLAAHASAGDYVMLQTEHEKRRHAAQRLRAKLDARFWERLCDGSIP